MMQQHCYRSVPKIGSVLDFGPRAHLIVCKPLPIPGAVLSRDLIIKCSFFGLWIAVKKISL